MIHISGSQARFALALLLLVLVGLPARAMAARVADLYAAAVPAGEDSTAGNAAAFAVALRQVLVKASGRQAAAETAVIATFGDPGTLVQQYRRDPAGNLWVQFDPAAMHASIDRLLALRPEAIYITHYGQLRDVPRLGADLHRLVDAHVDAALRHGGAGAGRHAGIKSALAEILLAEARRQGWRMASDALLELMAVDLELNAQGLCAWLDGGA